MSLRVKICGITSLADALAAVEAGADALGFMFYVRSPRYIRPELAAEISERLPGYVTRVGVFVDAPAESVKAVLGVCRLDLLQFHGDEPPEYCRQFGVPTMKAFRMRDADSLRALPMYDTEFWLLDAYVPGLPGGTGEVFNWQLAVAAKSLGRPFFLAGGLTPDNVAEAVRLVRPYGVDVSSGVESAPGKKDPAKLRAFVWAAKQGLNR
ncbi:MAG: phosphoribosylanthranilate isomerase [Verrucomicrobiae bacterium]|nr:phosphoribosylanthranilate isomerase [Verrucomicrobiae bacterium]MDW7979228.1 phosphoribosylanthranilate isomerase [Verrucomicrobiales bacterium]